MAACDAASRAAAPPVPIRAPFMPQTLPFRAIAGDNDVPCRIEQWHEASLIENKLDVCLIDHKRLEAHGIAPGYIQIAAQEQPLGEREPCTPND